MICASLSLLLSNILNYCLTWRHDSVLLKLFSSFKSFLGEGEALYVDLPGKRASDTPQATATSARPDMVLIRGLEITLIELTVPYDTRENLNGARYRKSNKSSYLELVSDLETKGYSATLITCEISSLCNSLPVCHKAIQKLFPLIARSTICVVFDAAAKIAISTSFSIFLARKELDWPSERPLFN